MKKTSEQLLQNIYIKKKKRSILRRKSVKNI